MVKGNEISARQFEILVILFSIGTTILVIPGSLAQVVKQDAWIAAVIGTGIGLLLVALYIAIGRMFPTKTLIEVNETLLGKWLGKAVSLTFVFFWLYSAASLLFYVGNFLTTQIIPDTPIEAINIIFACILIMGIRLGLETVARSAEIFFVFFIILFIILVIFVAPQIEFQHIQPVFETGIKSMMYTVFLFTSIFSLPLIALLMIFPVSVNQPKKAEKSFFIGILIGGICLIIIIALAILVLGADDSARQMYPSYALARKINVGNFIQRVEAIMAIMWFITIYFKMVIYFYASVIGLAQTFNLKDYQPLTLPLGVISVSLSLIIHPNVAQSATFDKEVWPLYVSVYGLVLPLLLLAVNGFRKKIHKNKKC
ncbi:MULTISPECIES: endospore germination permease [unclassified Bacillus (in: firmicutes)]|uniref:GerAB/ArcD/ProY family transporter n=1 Tax=unclassified Bacillus (in: firmicutes) TaxID=185979 RepID=UPI001BE886B3|nr:MULTISPECIES: endospore germination permease [unclassified Bacillus (in: firmicutes)]MBT2618875.1 endospore germination permease [Bacillus sp. ISL-78]MBT2627851.1 endospore germination permease [Bacillus sp. ISL-101]